jgi:hypothetical protein
MVLRSILKYTMHFAVNISAAPYNAISNFRSASTFNTKQKAQLTNKLTLLNIKPRFKSKLCSIRFSNPTIWTTTTSLGMNMD